MEQKPEGGGDTSARNNIHVQIDHSRNDNSRVHYGDNVQNITHNNNTPEDRLRSSKRAQDRLEEYVSKGAAHDSAERGTDAPKCFPETREAVQGEMMSFVDPGGEEDILWLSGPAGAGKTAIMGSVCDKCQALGWLAGSFYFSTAANKVDRCSSRYLIPTLAFHFFQLEIPGLPAAILASIDANPSVFDKRLDQQVEILLLRPLRQVCKTADLSQWPKVVVVDGVDECAENRERTYATDDDRRRSKEDNQREVLSALFQASSDPDFPFRILIASRPERAIEAHFASWDTGAFKKVFLDDKYTPEADIELFCRAKLTQIGLDRRLGNGWFAQVGKLHNIDDVPLHLANESSGQFVYAATVIRFVQGDLGSPQSQLGLALNWWATDASRPFAALDALYTGILQTSPEPHKAALWVRLGRSPGHYAHAYLQSSPGQIGHLLGRLSSLVRIMDADGGPDWHIYHKSLIDFLDDPGRSGDLHTRYDQVGDFLRCRNYEILKNRGPQVAILPPGSMQDFLDIFCEDIGIFFPNARKHQYVPEDVSWWLSNLDSTDLSRLLHLFYLTAHECCRWYKCRPVCKVWRTGIVRCAKANGMRVPVTLEGVWDRVKSFPWQQRVGDGRKITNGDILHSPVNAEEEEGLSRT